MRKPIDYKQYDTKWASLKYATKGESSTIKSAGCGITCAAMVIASFKDKNVTPVNTSKWSMDHGYKYLNQGTAYGYFKPQLAEYGIKCEQMNNVNVYHNKSASIHKTVKAELEKGSWIISVMSKGRWTSGGHYILAYALEDGYVYINDPASTDPNRLKAKLEDWQYEVKYYWKVEVPDSYKNYTPTSLPITKDSAPEDIEWLQTKLNNALKDVKGFVPLKVDKQYGLKTIAAVIQFYELQKWETQGLSVGKNAVTRLAKY